AEGQIDYEKRARDPLIESDPNYARDLLLALAERLDDWLARVTHDLPMRYAAETSTAAEAATSALRELEFLVSHTVHHYALIAIMCRLLGHETPAEFGVAPSTLRYQQAQATCAR
ncbi:MAG TPA: DinB family protein, partial [Candidatus Synoicihabitans sp.]|nr:DinB family protein [Candidatus Synoicihabitans sp.]